MTPARGGCFDGNKKYAQYNFFSVNNNLTNYRLDIGAYSGNAGDALGCNDNISHDGMALSTYDGDNDRFCKMVAAIITRLMHVTHL